MADLLTTLFIDKLIDIGAVPVYKQNSEGYETAVYTGKTGKNIFILISHEYMNERIGANYLEQLGYVTYVEEFFPGYLERHRKRMENDNNEKKAS